MTDANSVDIEITEQLRVGNSLPLSIAGTPVGTEYLNDRDPEWHPVRIRLSGWSNFSSTYEDIPGLSTSKEDMVFLWQDGISKELFLDIDAGVHFIDPNCMINLIPNWKQADVDEMVEQIAPFCGNTSFSTYPWHEDYPYYSLYEATEKVAEVFQRMDRFEALEALHDESITAIQDRLPPESERPEVKPRGIRLDFSVNSPQFRTGRCIRLAGCVRDQLSISQKLSVRPNSCSPTYSIRINSSTTASGYSKRRYLK